LREIAPVCDPAAAPAPEGDEVSVADMRRALAEPALGITVVDVREPAEWAIAQVEGTLKLPLSALPARVHELDPARTYYLHCKSGVRSLRAVAWLKARGFRAVKSVRGGLEAWAAAYAPDLPRY
jgi:adenylyltransferase/sulfurtransferase